MIPSEIVKLVYREHINNYGEPSKSWRFDNPPSGETKSLPSIIDVLVWPPENNIDMTTFATIGMSEKPMSGVNYRAELHFAVEGELDERAINKITIFLANLCMYPFKNSTFFDWWHILPNSGNIPEFPSASSVLLHPAFVKGGWELITTEFGQVKILNVIPITKFEYNLSKENGVNQLLDYLDDNKISYFAPR